MPLETLEIYIYICFFFFLDELSSRGQDGAVDNQRPGQVLSSWKSPHLC